MKRCLMFPGQGVQFKGMGTSLFTQYPQEVALAESVLGYSIVDCCNDSVRLAKTEYTQPAILFVSYLQYLASEQRGLDDVAYLMGHSLGEYTALLVAGVFDLETALKVVSYRGKLMGQIQNGGMAALVHDAALDLTSKLSGSGISIEIANYNTPKQTVISGSLEDVRRCKAFCDAEGISFFPLAVSGAFHSSYMKEAAEQFDQFLSTVDFKEPKVPVVSNVTASPIPGNEIKNILVQQMYSSVQWVNSIQYVRSQNKNIDFQEIGPREILGKMVKTIKEELPIEKVKTEVELKSFDIPFSVTFKQRYKLTAPLMAGGMYKGVSSVELVSAMAKAGFLASLGAGGMKLESIEVALKELSKVDSKTPVCINVLANHNNPYAEIALVQLLLTYGFTVIEAAAFIDVTPALVLFKIKGLKKEKDKVVSTNRIIVKLSHEKVAENFLTPISDKILLELLNKDLISISEFEIAKGLIIADDITVEADSAGHTDRGIASVLLPAIKHVRDRKVKEHAIEAPVHVGLAGGIGTPESVLSALVLGADYVVTGSINQVTIESGQSREVKEALQCITTADTTYAPAGDMFEMGAIVQVLKKGSLFPMRAQKLLDLYKRYSSIDDIDFSLKKQLTKMFGRSLEEVYEECKAHHSLQRIEKAEQNPKYKMLLIFKWYYAYATRQAMSGGSDTVNYQVHCGSSLGAFNSWTKGGPFEHYSKRGVVEINQHLLKESERVFMQLIKNTTGY